MYWTKFWICTCAVPPPPVLSNFIIMIIVAAVLAVISLLLLTTTIACAVRANRLRLVHNTILAWGNSQHVRSTPLTVALSPSMKAHSQLSILHAKKLGIGPGNEACCYTKICVYVIWVIWGAMYTLWYYLPSDFSRKELLEATYVENEIAFARTQGAFTLPNPLAVIKDEGEHHTQSWHHGGSVHVNN